MVDEFGARIAKLRKARNLSQRALVDRAKALDPNLRLSHSALGSYERNSTVPRLAEAVALADVLDVSLDFLLRGEAYRTLPLKNLTDEQTQLLLDLSVYFRQQNSADREKKSMELRPAIITLQKCQRFGDNVRCSLRFCSALFRGYSDVLGTVMR